MPRTEPNSLPPTFADWADWREVYEDRVDEYNASPKDCGDELYLRIRLKRLGFYGANLEREMTYIKEGGN